MIRVNLLDASFSAGGVHVSPGRRDLVAIVGLVVTVLSVAGGWWWLSSDVTAVLRQLDAERSRLTALEREETTVAALRARRAQYAAICADIDARRARGLTASSFLLVLSETMPADVWLVAIEYDDTTITIEGRAASVGAVAQWVERLNTVADWPWLVAVADIGRVAERDEVSFVVRGTVR